MEQFGELAPMVQILDAPVPLMVDQLAEILKNDVEQVIEVPKIKLLDKIPRRAVLRVPPLAEQLVEVPVRALVTLARGWDAGGPAWSRVWGRRGSSGGCPVLGISSGGPRMDSGGLQMPGKGDGV